MLHEWLYGHPVLTLAQTLFMLWMLVDAARRKAEFFWFWIILLLPVIGAWAYFFVVKIGDFEGGNLEWLFRRTPSLDELRFRARETPTLVNHLALGQRLVELKRYDEAAPQFEAALRRESDHPSALFGLAQCKHTQSRHDEAIQALTKLLARDPRWSNYRAWHLLVAVREAMGDIAGALTVCRELHHLAPSLHHACLLAERLLAAGRSEEARGLLERALQAHAYAPAFARRRDRCWARQARKLAKQAAVHV